MIACTGEYKNFSHYRVSRMINVKETELAAKDIKLNETYKNCWQMARALVIICASILICGLVIRSG